jgi:predicted DsbA family dithiol-disulfide isomerase
MEIHPETPAEGRSIASMFPKARLEAMTVNLNSSGSKYGIKFNNLSVLSNSKLSLLAGEFAKEHGKFHEYHEYIFRSYFTDGKDIGNLDVVLQAIEAVGLDTELFNEALNANKYEKNLDNTQNLAHEYSINSTPTFIINNKYAIVGAQPIEAFREALKGMIKE